MSHTGQELELGELIKKIMSLELPKVDIKELCTPCPSIEIDDFIEILKNPADSVIIDVRSESEYAESHIPTAINLPIFNDSERHNVGLLFKQKSEQLAEQVGAYYAYQKLDAYVKSIKEIADVRKIYVHCWRGGNRSKSVTALLIKNGLNATRLNGGIKSFRRLVHHFFYKYDLKLIALSGQTGTGKSEVLEEMQQTTNIPVLHLEEAANHASSVFGPVRFDCAPIHKQQEFETRLFSQILPWINKSELPLFITEKESPKIGRLTLPPAIQKALDEDKHIRLTCPLHLRVERLRREYIDTLKSGQKDYLRERLTYLKRMLSTETLNEYLDLFDKENWDILLEKILVDYYDKVYKTTTTPPILEIDNISIPETISSIIKNIK